MRRRDFLRFLGLSGAVVGSGVGLLAVPIKVSAEDTPIDVDIQTTYEPSEIPASVEPDVLSESQNFPLQLVEMDWSAMLDEYLKEEGLDFRSVPGRLPDDDYKETQVYLSYLVLDEDCLVCNIPTFMGRYVEPWLAAIASMLRENRYYPSSRRLPICAGSGMLCHISDGGQVPIRCSMHYDVRRAGILVALDTLVLEA